MNNNRGNNRRRGRGNNRPQNGGQQLNRIDSRARGNAPQLLEKYRKLAQDAHLNGDRVQAEYYLQFADHYFRVIADTRARQDENRQRSGNDRWQDSEGEDENLEFGMDNDFPTFDRAPRREEPREQREPREQQREPREQREPRRRFNREEAAEAAPAAAVETAVAVDEGVRADEGEPVSNVADNPFVRDSRASRGLRPRGERRPRRDQAEGDAPAGLDPTSLPPAIGVRAEASEPELPMTTAPAASVEEAPPAPKRRGRPRKNPLPEAPASVEG